MKKTLYNIALLGSLLYVALILLSYVMSQELPRSHSLNDNLQSTSCFWGKFGDIRCGRHVEHREWLALFYSFHMSFKFVPLLMLVMPSVRGICYTVAIYTPLVFLALAFYKRLGPARSSIVRRETRAQNPHSNNTAKAKTSIYTVALYGSLLYALLIPLSYFLSTRLPDFYEAGTQRDDLCYWALTQNSLASFVTCGDQVFAGDLRGGFYNFWQSPLYRFFVQPEIISGFAKDLFGWAVVFWGLVALTLLFYVPFIFLAYVFVRWTVRKLRGG